MGEGIRTQLRRRRLQRWLRSEAQLLAQEAEAFDCPEINRAAQHLLGTTSGVGNLWVLRSA